MVSSPSINTILFLSHFSFLMFFALSIIGLASASNNQTTIPRSALTVPELPQTTNRPVSFGPQVAAPLVFPPRSRFIVPTLNRSPETVVVAPHFQADRQMFMAASPSHDQHPSSVIDQHPSWDRTTEQSAAAPGRDSTRRVAWNNPISEERLFSEISDQMPNLRVPTLTQPRVTQGPLRSILRVQGSQDLKRVDTDGSDSSTEEENSSKAKKARI